MKKFTVSGSILDSGRTNTCWLGGGGRPEKAGARLVTSSRQSLVALDEQMAKWPCLHHQHEMKQRCLIYVHTRLLLFKYTVTTHIGQPERTCSARQRNRSQHFLSARCLLVYRILVDAGAQNCEKRLLACHVCLSVRPSVRPSIRPSIRPSVCPSIRPPVHPSVCASVYPSVRK